MISVLTLDQEAFDEACASLASRVLLTDNVKAVIGIKTGGAIVGKNVHISLCAANKHLKYFEVGASRCGTAAKNLKGTKGFFGLVPYVLLDFMRVFEYVALSFRMRIRKNVDRTVFIDDDLLNYISTITEGCVFVIDDAVDSGATLKGVLRDLRKKNPLLNYKSAVITVTQKTPEIYPDIYLYSEVLIRFPWSSDYK